VTVTRFADAQTESLFSDWLKDQHQKRATMLAQIESDRELAAVQNLPSPANGVSSNKSGTKGSISKNISNAQGNKSSSSTGSTVSSNSSKQKPTTGQSQAGSGSKFSFFKKSGNSGGSSGGVGDSDGNADDGSENNNNSNINSSNNNNSDSNSSNNASKMSPEAAEVLSASSLIASVAQDPFFQNVDLDAIIGGAAQTNVQGQLNNGVQTSSNSASNSGSSQMQNNASNNSIGPVDADENDNGFRSSMNDGMRMSMNDGSGSLRLSINAADTVFASPLSSPTYKSTLNNNNNNNNNNSVVDAETMKEMERKMNEHKMYCYRRMFLDHLHEQKRLQFIKFAREKRDTLHARAIKNWIKSWKPTLFEDSENASNRPQIKNGGKPATFSGAMKYLNPVMTGAATTTLKGMVTQ
jgi:predicted GIY-YIG superfamily endonuclease